MRLREGGREGGRERKTSRSVLFFILETLDMVFERQKNNEKHTQGVDEQAYLPQNSCLFRKILSLPPGYANSVPGAAITLRMPHPRESQHEQMLRGCPGGVVRTGAID